MILKPLEMAQEIVRQSVLAGECVVDATMGNGHDTLFLSKCVGDGLVVGFDVQEQAVKATRERLEQAGVQADRYSLHGCGHGPVAAVMFNLGYLPRADKAVITTVETTLPALQQAIGLLREGGVLTVMCYPGHEGGAEEAEAVVEWAKALERRAYRVLRYGMVNAPNAPAFLLAVEKLSS
jgi:tRNA A58 N-methylase Trm61